MIEVKWYFILEQFHIDESANKMSLSTVNALVLVVNAQSPELATPTPEFQEVRIKNNINDSNGNKSDSFCIVPEG